MFHDTELGISARGPKPVVDRTDGHFSLFVSDESDIVGLVAFALHERQAREWREEMARACGRPPTADEIRAHRVGEATPRRILAYRFLASEHLAGRGSDCTARRTFSEDPVFELFCSSQHDFVGLVAYAIHEQQVREWRDGMQRACGRAPTEDELRAHRISETTPRRILAYRFLAGERIAGRGPDLTPGVAKVSFIARALAAGIRGDGRSTAWRGWALKRI
jgi:hypothetical protein